MRLRESVVPGISHTPELHFLFMIEYVPDVLQRLPIGIDRVHEQRIRLEHVHIAADKMEVIGEFVFLGARTDTLPDLASPYIMPMLQLFAILTSDTRHATPPQLKLVLAEHGRAVMDLDDVAEEPVMIGNHAARLKMLEHYCLRLLCEELLTRVSEATS